MKFGTFPRAVKLGPRISAWRAADIHEYLDLDPASCADAQQTVRARKYFTKADDALQRSWWGRVFLNPPFGRELIGPFVRKLLAEYSAGRVSEAILLVTSNTSAGWFQQAARVADAICFTDHNIAFIHATHGAMGRAAVGQAFFYFGPDVEKFARRFADVGFLALGLINPFESACSESSRGAERRSTVAINGSVSSTPWSSP